MEDSNKVVGMVDFQDEEQCDEESNHIELVDAKIAKNSVVPFIRGLLLGSFLSIPGLHVLYLLMKGGGVSSTHQEFSSVALFWSLIHILYFFVGASCLAFFDYHQTTRARQFFIPGLFIGFSGSCVAGYGLVGLLWLGLGCSFAAGLMCCAFLFNEQPHKSSFIKGDMYQGDSLNVPSCAQKHICFPTFLFGAAIGAIFSFLGFRLLFKLLPIYPESLLVHFVVAWCVLTSTAAYCCAEGAKCLLSKVYEGSPVPQALCGSDFDADVEFYYTVGVFSGFCSAITISDILLRMPWLAVILTTVTAFLWVFVMGFVYQNGKTEAQQKNEDRSTSMAVPLLSKATEEDLDAPTPPCLEITIHMMAVLVLGVLIGIVFSLIGLHIVISWQAHESNNMLVFFALGWSTVTSAVAFSLFVMTKMILFKFYTEASPFRKAWAQVDMEYYFAIAVFCGFSLECAVGDFLLSLSLSETFVAGAAATLLVLIMVWAATVAATSNKKKQEGTNLPMVLV